jgi:uncharacterized protein DUF3800
MNALFSVKDLASAVLPRGGRGGILGMLTAYFDDSGTHDDSDVVIIAGLSGNQHQWQAFENAWRAKLQSPSPGKPPLSRFHMYECHNALGEFSGWGRTATEFVAHELGQIIIKNGLWAYGCAVLRKDWDASVTGLIRTALGDAEGFCARQCFVMTLAWASKYASDSHIAFVFDHRPHRRWELDKLFELFQREGRRDNKCPELASLSVASSKQFLPLQGADLMAWEFYHHATDVLYRGVAQKDFQRPQLRALSESGRCRLQLANADQIKRIAAEAATYPTIADTAAFMQGD